VAYSLAVAYAQLGDAAAAMQWLRFAAGSGFPCAIWYLYDPLLEPLRDNADFKQLLSAIMKANDTRRAGPAIR
jgi:hypothetical protein